ncbi:hypothetical protein Pfo_017014 [Paulownia fortunei]|nr:hypothetical protein Pfo_017014 [Paulownia fortunei]
MVSEDSSSHSNNSIPHEFVASSSSTQNQFGNQHFDAYGTDSVSNSPYSQSLPLSIRCLGESMSRSVDFVHTPQPSDECDINQDKRLMDLLGTSNEAAHRSRRLSLSLGSVPCRQKPLNSNVLNPGYLSSGAAAKEACNVGFDRVINDYTFDGSAFAPSSASLNQSWLTSYETESFAAAIGSSKYLQPTQSLLEEMLSIGGKDIDTINQKYMEKLSRGSRRGSFSLSSKLKAEFSNSELLCEKHANYINLLKLIALLEEVERRYEEYSHHMEELVTSFEAIAGLGSGKSYIALALQAMSKHFCSLRNALLSQIHVTKQKIADDMPKVSSRLSQLSLFDQEARQNLVSLQQLGIMHNPRQAWRTIRGLPETSGTILRAWLFEHFLHPYPNDSEKLILASQTGLSKNQVSNWFINARVRLWKPMIEEMYKEEFADSSTESDQLLTSSSTRKGEGDST